jgi:hypothetical protein
MLKFMRWFYDWLLGLFWYVSLTIMLYIPNQHGFLIADPCPCNQHLSKPQLTQDALNQGNRNGRDDRGATERGQNVVVEGFGGKWFFFHGLGVLCWLVWLALPAKEREGGRERSKET